MLPAVNTTSINPLGVELAVQFTTEVVVASASACTNDVPAIAAVVPTFMNAQYHGIVPLDTKALFAPQTGSLVVVFEPFLYIISPIVVIGSLTAVHRLCI